MRIVERDLVDWEPLHIVLVPYDIFTDPGAIAAHLAEWFAENAREGQPECDIRYYRLSTLSASCIEAYCELLSKKALRRLAQSLETRFAEIDCIELGEVLATPRHGLQFEWVLLPEAMIALDSEPCTVKPVAISFDAVTVGQFTEFLTETGYKPTADRSQGQGYLLTSFRLTFGRSTRVPLFGASFDDASAYCEWAGLRLPTEPELHHFFVSMVHQGREFKWHGDCWTSTLAAPDAPDTYIVRNGPYRLESLQKPASQFRRVMHRRDYQHPHAAACFRVARGRVGGTQVTSGVQSGC